jgi:hypothetical protein
MEYVVYCDESRHSLSKENQFMAIGGLWLPRARKVELTKQFRALCDSYELRGEIKWSKASTKRFDGYKQLVDFFVSDPDLKFRVIVVEHAKLDWEKYHGGDRELGFYKFYYQMLRPWIERGNEYLILLDFQKNKGSDRYKNLRTFLERATQGEAWITDLTVIDSYESPLGQLSDLLTGAVAADWCGVTPGSPKWKLAAHLARACGFPSLRTASVSPTPSKLNIFRINLQ